MSFRYRVFGLSIRSEVELPELDTESGGSVDLTVRLVRRGAEEEEGIRTRITANEVFTSPPYIGRCWIRGGREIELEPVADVESGVIRLFLLGTALGVILHQRGFLVLHASSVLIDGRAVAFVGASGLGKSTLAAAFDAAGYPVVADDIGAIALERGKGEILRGFRQIRLWPDAALASGYDPALLPLLHSGVEKRSVRPSEAELPERIPLAAIYIPRRIESLGAYGSLITDLDIQQRVLELVRHTFTARMLSDSEVAVDHFRQCAAVVRSVPVFGLGIPHGLDTIPAVVDAVVETIAGGRR